MKRRNHNASKYDIYKFLKHKSTVSEMNYMESTAAPSISPNIYLEIDGQKHHKTYTILQETRSEFITNRRLRALLLIYSNIVFKIFILTTLAVAYFIDTCVYTFYEAAHRPLWCIIVLLCCNVIYAFDVAIVFGLKISKKMRKSLNLVEPGTFTVVLNVILAMPYPLMYLMYETDLPFHFHQIAPLIATVRVYRILEYLYDRSSQAGSNQWTTFLSQYLILFSLGVHTWTCVWYIFANKSFSMEKINTSWSVASIYLPTESVLDWYFVCMYTSIMFFTTNSLGDLYPVTTYERLVAIIGILVGFLLTTIVFVGSLTSQFITITTRRSEYVQKLVKIKNNLRLINMDVDTTKRILRYYKDLWAQKSGVFQPKLLKMLPYPLQMEICYDLNAVPLYSSLVFRKLPESFLRRLSLDMTHAFYLPGDVVYSHSQNKTCMVCITKGILELLSDEDDESPMISFTKGTCFGEIALVYNIPARCIVRAATYVECQVLEKTKFIKLIISYPNVYHRIRKEIGERIKRCQSTKLKQGKQAELTLNIYASKDRKKSSIKCLKERLRYIQGKSAIDKITPEDHLDEHCLDLYIISDHVKKQNSQFTCRQPHFPWILEADCPLVKYWELYMLAIVCYVSIVYPYFIGFERNFTEKIHSSIQVLITISLILNIFVTSITAIKTKKKYIRTFKAIISYRMNTLGFYLDMLAIIPFEYMVTIHMSVSYYDNYREHLFYLVKGLKLCLIWRLSSFFEKLEKNLLLNTLVVKIAKYCVYLCLLCYWSGVILYMESCFVSRCSQNSWFSNALLWDDQKVTDRPTRTQYPIITAVYFASSILLSISYGDFTPGDTFDLVFVAFLSLYGVLLLGYFISEFSSVITHLSRTKTAFLEVIMTIDKFMNENNMHQTIKSRIMAFYELQWQYNSGVSMTDDNLLDNSVVPTELQKKVVHQARFKALTSIQFFQVKNKAYIQTLTESAKDIILPPGEIVFYAGTISRELYIIESGYCVITGANKKQQKIIGPGQHVGLLVLLYGIPTIFTVVTLTHCKLVSLTHSAYTSALSLFPNMEEHNNIFTPEEMQKLEKLRQAEMPESYHVHPYQQLTVKKQKVKITSLLQQFFDNSFIDLRAESKKQKSNSENYWKSYKQFRVLNNIAPFLLMPYVIKPDGIFLKIWAALRVFVAFWLCLLIPITVTLAPSFSLFNIPIVIMEAICYLDLYLMLHVAYYGPKNQLIYHPYMTAKNYLQGRFIIDFLISFPWYALWNLLDTYHNEYHTPEDHIKNSHLFHCILRLINVTQIIKVCSISYSDSIGALKREYLMSVMHFLLITLFCLNLYTSILIMLSCKYVIGKDPDDFLRKIQNIEPKRHFLDVKYHPDGNMVCYVGSWVQGISLLKESRFSYTKVYLVAYYWTVNSFGGAGIGDIVPQNITHMILSSIINLHGVLFFGYVYAKIASLKALGDQVVTKFHESLKHLDFFLSTEHLPVSLKKTVMEYWKYQWKRTGGWSHQSILGKLHANLNEDAVLYMYEKTLSEIPLFEDVEYSFFRAFAKKLRENYFQKGYMVMRCNEVMETMYIIFRGKVDILSNINEVEACMGPGGIFGNIKGSTKYLTQSNVIASRNIDVLCIKGQEFYSLLKSYPSVLRKVKMSIESAPKDYVLPSVMTMSADKVVSFPSTYETGEDDEDDFETDANVNSRSPDKSIAESHGSRSITSTSNLDYTAATLLIFKPHRWFRSSIIPDSKLVKTMEYIILGLSYIDFMLLVYQLAFLSIPHYFYICLVSDIVFLYKCFLDIHTGYMNRYGDYILHPKKVRKRYFSNIYCRRRDFLANFIVCYFVFLFNFNIHVKIVLFCYTRTPQLVRISYLYTYRTHGKSNIGSANLFFKLMSIAITASILTHVCACLFFKFSCITPAQCTSTNWMIKKQLYLRSKYYERKYFDLYVASLWYIINLLTIAGTGDVSSQNCLEAIETVLIVVIIKFCTGLLISETSAMITAHASSRIAYDYDINELRDGLHDMNLSNHQMDKMWAYVRQLWNRQQGKQMPDLVHKLPFRLRGQVMQAIYGNHIRESIIFRDTDEDFRRMLVMWMKHCVFFPGNYIVQCGDSDQCVYFIHRGQVEVLSVHSNLTESIYDVLGPEDSFGVAQGLFVGVQHHFSFRARTVVDIVYLKLDEWKYLMDYYPESAEIIKMKLDNVYLSI